MIKWKCTIEGADIFNIINKDCESDLDYPEKIKDNNIGIGIGYAPIFDNDFLYYFTETFMVINESDYQEDLSIKDIKGSIYICSYGRFVT